MTAISPEQATSFRPCRPRRDSGFALVMTIWVMGAVALLFTTYIASARYRGIEAAATLERAEGEALADAGVNLGIMDLLTREAAGPRATNRPGQDMMRICHVGSAVLAVAVSNENGKVDLNTGDPNLLRTLLLQATGNADQARLATASILAVRQSATAASSSAASSTAQPLGNKSPVADAFRSVVDVGGLPGFDASLYAELEPLLTVHSRSAGINPTLAPSRLRKMLAGNADGSSPSGDASLFFVAEAPGSLYRVAAEAATRTGMRVVREAIVEMLKSPHLGYAVREWRDGRAHIAPTMVQAGALEPC